MRHCGPLPALLLVLVGLLLAATARAAPAGAGAGAEAGAETECPESGEDAEAVAEGLQPLRELPGFWLTECVADGGGGYTEACLHMDDSGRFRLRRAMFSAPGCRSEALSAVTVSVGRAWHDVSAAPGAYRRVAFRSRKHSVAAATSDLARVLSKLFMNRSPCTGRPLRAGERCTFCTAGCVERSCSPHFVHRDLHGRYRVAVFGPDGGRGSESAGTGQEGDRVARAAKEEEEEDDEDAPEADGGAHRGAEGVQVRSDRPTVDDMLLLTRLEPSSSTDGDSGETSLQVADVFKESPMGCEDFLLRFREGNDDEDAEDVSSCRGRARALGIPDDEL